MPHLAENPKNIVLPDLPSRQDTRRDDVAKSIFLSSARVFFFQCLGLALSFGFQAFLSHTCGAAGLGGYTLIVSWLGLLSVVTVPGLEGTLVYLLPRFENASDLRRKVVRICLFLAGTISTLSALAVIAGGGRAFYWVGLPAKAKSAFAFSIVVFSLGKLLDAVFLGLRDASATGYFNAVRILLRFLFCIPILLYPTASWSIIFVAVASECGLTLLLRVYSIRKRYPELSTAGQHRIESPSLSYPMFFATAIPMFGIGIVDSLFPFMDKAILGALLPLQLVGIYKVSESLASLSSIFVSPFISFWPFVSKLCHENRIDELSDAYRNINLLIIALMIPCVLALVEVSGFVLSLFGSAFLVYGKTTFLILTLGCVFDAIAGPAGAVLKLTGHSHLCLGVNASLLVIYIALSFLLARAYGLLGIAIAKSSVLILGNIVNVIANRFLLRIFPYSWKHGQLLLLGSSILTAAALVHASSVRLHFFVACGEVSIFVCAAAIIVHPQIRQAIAMIRNDGYLPNAADCNP